MDEHNQGYRTVELVGVYVWTKVKYPANLSFLQFKFISLPLIRERDSS